MNPVAYSILCFGFCSFLIGILVWLRLKSDIGFKYFIFSAFSGLWGMLYGITAIESTSYSTALLTVRISNVIAALIGPAWYHFILAFTGKNSKKQKTILIAFYLVGFFVVVNVFSPHFISSVKAISIFKGYGVTGWIFHVHTTNFFLSVCLGFISLFRYLQIQSGDKRKSCYGLFISTLVGFVGGSIAFFPAYKIDFPGFLIFFMPLYPVLIAISMMRFDLFSIENFAQAAHKDKLAALGVLTASINHEIRSPLFLMRGMIEVEGKDSPLGIKLLSQINRVTDIVARLTYFAKKGVDEEAKIESLDLKEVLTDIRPLFQHQLNYQDIQYRQEIPNDLPKVMADRRYLEEILFNLILNACQALKNTPHPTIKLSASILEDRSFSHQSSVISSSTIVISIVDNGPGFTDKQLKNVFKPFHTTKEEGTGLGLYITRQLVEKCGGKIEIKSVSGKGTQFLLQFQGV